MNFLQIISFFNKGHGEGWRWEVEAWPGTCGAGLDQDIFEFVQPFHKE